MPFHSTDAFPPPGPPLIDTVQTDDIRWGSYRVSCPRCGASHGWTLHIERASEWALGEYAWGICAEGHRVDHPLIYPEMVQTLIDWSIASTEPLDEVLRRIQWQPHQAHCSSSDWSDEPSIVIYRPWTLSRTAIEYWTTAWPDLLASAGVSDDL